MADNVTVPATGAVLRTKDHSGVETQVVALDLNPAGAESLMAGAMPVTDNSGSLTVDAPVGTPVFVRLSDGTTAIATLPVSLASLPALAAGTAAIGKLAANSGVDIGDVDVTSVPADPFGANADAAVAAGATGSIQAKLRRLTQGLEDLKTLIVLGAGTALIGKVNLDPRTSGGLTIYRSLSVDSTGVNIKSSPGQVYGWYYANTASTFRYLKLYNKASAPTVGTDTPVMTIPLPPLSAANVEYTNGIAFATGIGIGCVTAVADNSTANVTANDVIANVYYA